MKDARSGKIALVAHCILNQNCRVFGLAKCPGMVTEILNLFERNGYGVVQMPCPELTFTGLRRWSQTREQYDTPMFRRHCKTIAVRLVDQIQQYIDNGMKVSVVVGVEGSPSCGVSETSSGYMGGKVGEIRRTQKKSIKQPGIFIEELVLEMEKRGITVPLFGIDDERIKENMDKLAELLNQSSKSKDCCSNVESKVP